MILDGHVHIHPGTGDRTGFVDRLQEAGVGGAVLVSLRPTAGAPEARLEDLMAWAETGPNLYPFFWVDPTAHDAIVQVERAVERGVAGFKVICSDHYPGDERAMPTYRAIAAVDRPILFHSGILWDGLASARYNRPGEFEALLRVDGLRFALAHISWPWCDELIAVYGKFLNACVKQPDLSVEMYIDTTPGTPPIYRREALTKLFTVGYDVAHNVIFGSDSNTQAYNVDWVGEWVRGDREILEELGVGEETIDGVFGGNLRRFLGISGGGVRRALPRVGE